MKKKIMLLLILLSLLISCSQTPNYDQNYRTGSKGISLNYVKGYPPPNLNENEPIPILLKIANLGAFDIPYNKINITFSYDPLYVKGPKSFSFKNKDIFHGRSEYYPDGQDQLIELYEFSTNKIIGERSKPETDFVTQICYPYNTIFVDSICVDVDYFLKSGRPQSCQYQPIKATTQGAPIAVVSIDVKNNMIPQTRTIIPSFLIQISNVGKGIVIGSQEGGCEHQTPQTKGTVKIDARLLGVDLECNPQYIRLRNGVGITKCTVSTADENNPLLQPQYNFMTPIIINLSYVYQDIFSQRFTITKYDNGIQTGINPNDLEDGVVKGYMYDDDNNLIRGDNGYPMTMCAYYADNSDKAPSDLQAYIDGNFSCGCSLQECRDLDSKKKCFYGLCPGNLECCNKKIR